jgi:hypothetical protein
MQTALVLDSPLMRDLDPMSSAEAVRRHAGFAGLVGAVLFAIGHMLFYGFWGPGTGFAEGCEPLSSMPHCDGSSREV